MRRRSYIIVLKQIFLCQAQQRDLNIVAPLSHRPIVLTDTIDYRTIGFCTIVLNLPKITAVRSCELTRGVPRSQSASTECVYRVEEVEGRRKEAKAGTQSASSVHSTPGVATRAEVSTHSLSEQRGRRRAFYRPQPH